MYVTYTRIYGWSDYGGESSYQPGYRLENMMWMTLLVYDYIIPGENDYMKENTLSYTTRIGKTTFIVNVKQSESAKKPLNTVFQEICRHEMLGDFSADKYLNLENLQKSS